MNADWTQQLAAPGGGPGFDIDVFREADGEIVEAFLVTQDTREPYPIIAGVGVVPPSLREHLHDYGNVYRRTPLRDPRMVRFVIGRVGSGHDAVPFDEVVAHYRDLALEPPPDYDTTAHADDVALAGTLRTLVGEATPARALDIGCGVGRSSFTLRACARRVLGVDFSLALVRRARNIAVTVEDFFLPGPRVNGAKGEAVLLDLGSLARDGVDFVAACGAHLPLRDDVMDLVVVHERDARGPWAEPDAVCREALRVLRAGGMLVWHRSLPFDLEAAVTEGPFRGAVPA